MSCVRVSGLPCALAPNLSSKVCHLIRGNVYSTTYFALRIEGHIHQFPIQFICNVDRVKSFHVNVECPTATGGYDWFFHLISAALVLHDRSTLKFVRPLN